MVTLTPQICFMNVAFSSARAVRRSAVQETPFCTTGLRRLCPDQEVHVTEVGKETAVQSDLFKSILNIKTVLIENIEACPVGCDPYFVNGHSNCLVIDQTVEENNPLSFKRM